MNLELPITKAKRRAIIVLGMHRSGASALAKALGLLGIRQMGQVEPADMSNPKGHFESAKIINIHDRALAAAGTKWSSFDALPDNWFRSVEAVGFADELVAALQRDYEDVAIFVIKDPRMCRLMPLWRTALNKVGAHSTFVIPFRHPIEVARSLERRNDFPLAEGCLLWLRHLLEAERETRGTQRIFLRYRDLLDDSAGIAKRITSHLSDGWDPKAEKERSKEIKSFIDPKMHHDFMEEDPPAFSCRWLGDTYEAHIALVHCPDDEQAQRRLDRVRADFDVAATLFCSLLERKASDLEARIATMGDQVERFREVLAERKDRIAALEQALTERDAKISSLQTTISALFASRSWQITKPLRNAKRLLERSNNSAIGFFPRVTTKCVSDGKPDRSLLNLASQKKFEPDTILEQLSAKGRMYSLQLPTSSTARASGRGHNNIPTIHAFVISWPGQHAKAVSVAKSIDSVADKVSIVYSDADPKFEINADFDLIRRPNYLYFGDKFKACIDQFDGDLLMIIHGDCSCSDWAELVLKCKQAYSSINKIGVWSPLIDHTFHNILRTYVATIDNTSLHIVAQTDGIVLCITKSIVNRMRLANYDKNVYGWGITWMITSYAYSINNFSVIDSSILVQHPAGSGYPTEIADLQKTEFIKQFTLDELIQYTLLNRRMHKSLFNETARH